MDKFFSVAYADVTKQQINLLDKQRILKMLLSN